MTWPLGVIESSQNFKFCHKTYDKRSISMVLQIFNESMYSQSAVEMEWNQDKLYFHCELYIQLILNVQCKYTGTMTEWKVLYFLWKYYLQCTLALQKKKNYDEKMMVFWTFSRSFQSCSNSPIALLFSDGIVVCIYYYSVFYLTWFELFHIKRNLEVHREIEKIEVLATKFTTCCSINKILAVSLTRALISWLSLLCSDSSAH